MSTLGEGLLLRGQRAWVADDSRLKVCEKGRRTGITWAEASDDVLIASTNRDAGGQNVFYFPQAKEDAIEYIETAAKWAHAYDRAAGEIEHGSWEDEIGVVLPVDDPDKGIQTYRIRFPSGNRIVALSSAPSRARGKQGIFVLDEAAFHPDLPGVLKAVLATILRGGKVRVISTHNGENNPFNELVTEIRSGRRKGTVHRYPFKEAVADGMYRRICEIEDTPWSADAQAAWVADAYAFYGDDASEELDAVPKSGSGTFLSGVLIESRMGDAQDGAHVPVLRLAYETSFATRPRAERTSECAAWIEDHLDAALDRLDTGLEHGYGMDFGRTGDLSAIAVWERAQDLTLWIPLIIEMRNTPFDQQEQVLFYVIDRLPNFRCGANDARGNGQSVAEHAWQQYGTAHVLAVMLSTEWYRTHGAPFKAAFEDDTIRIPRDADVRADLRTIRMDNGVAKIPDNAHGTGTDGKPRHGDTAIAIWLAHYASRQDVEWEYDGYIPVRMRGEEARARARPVRVTADWRGAGAL